MKTLFVNIAVATFMLFAFTSCAADDTNSVETQQTSLSREVSVTYSNLELDIITVVNQYRKKIGLNELSKLDIASSVAESHTSYMISQGKISHDNFNQRAAELKESAKAITVGENVAFGYKTAEDVLKGWLNSPSHRKQIESRRYTHIGISTKADSKGRNYFTQMFVTK